ncbi:MAG: flagellar hook capping FlgD N-terminal domain-containing protein [Bacillota bacterium]
MRVNATDQSSATMQWSEFGGTEFLQLFAAQMQNQNPLEPMNGREMMTQMVQMTTLSETRQIRQLLEMIAQQLVLGWSTCQTGSE